MLRSRRRASSSPPSNRPPSASASLAASKAFLRDRESNGALSSAAAAAALRTHAATPTPVGDTVTKRMVRKASLSSQGSGSQQHPGLRRHSSSGSMTERTFRAPSPSRSSPIDGDAPPVPPVPKNVPQVGIVHRRTSSLEPPARGGSPAVRGGGRGVSLDRETSNAGRGRGQPRVSPLAKVVEDDHDGAQRASINFSRPISPPQAPSATTRGGHSGWFAGPVVNPEQTFRGTKPRPKTSDGLSAYATQQAVQNAANKPVSTRTADMSHGVEGARWAAGSMRTNLTGTTVQAQPTHTATRNQPRIVDPNSPFAVYDPSSRKFIHKQDAMDLHRALSDAEDPAPPYEPEQIMAQAHQETPRYSQPAGERHQNRNIIKRSASPPVREAPQSVGYMDHSGAAAPAPTATSEAHGIAISPDEPVAVTFAEADDADDADDAEDRLPTDANTGRMLGSSVSGQGLLPSPKLDRNQDSPYPRLTPTAAVSSSGPPSTQGSTWSERSHSLSPPRNAHFAPVAVEYASGIKHQPPGRSVSPAKSALKASPSVSGRHHSPLANGDRVIGREALSDASDAGSEDGGKKKKKVRISFDEEPTVVGRSAYADTDPAGTAASNWDLVDEDEDDFMKPRPVLPSFGSIRDKNRRSKDEDVPEKVTETVSSSLSNSTTFPAEQAEVSSDHKIGGILARDFAAKNAEPSSNNPLPPEVTSVEGSGYSSDSDQSAASDLKPLAHTRDVQNPELAPSIPKSEPKTLTNPVEPRPQASEVPTIAVQPASPFLPEEPMIQSTSKEPRPFVPGGWDEDDVFEPEATKQPSPASPTPSQPSISIQIPTRPVEDDSSDDTSSVYSDAYEDLEEAEGFGSIDAIMESPIASSQGLLMNKLIPTEVPKSVPQAPVVEARTEPRRETQVEPLIARVNRETERKVEVEPAVASQTQAPPSLPAKVPAQPRKSALKKSTAPSTQAITAEIPLKKTMRNREPTSNGAGPQIRRTMRGSDATFASRGSPEPTARRQSMPPLDRKPPRGALQKKRLPAAATSSAARPRPQSASGVPVNTKLFTPAPTYDSDSDVSVSSFQRERRRTRASRQDNGRYTMRASMRSAPSPTLRAAPHVRSISPPVSSSPPSTLRKSLRSSSPNPEPPNTSRFSIRSLSPVGRFRRRSTMDAIPPIPPIQPSPPKKVAEKKSIFGKPNPSKPSPAKPRYQSRLADSSDEDIDLPRRFQSRFADSDSEDDDFELPPGLAPVRGIPKRPGEEDGDSTDLEDEVSDHETSPAPITNGTGMGKSAATNGTTNMQGANLAAGSLREKAGHLPTFGTGKKKQKRGFFGLGRKKNSYLADAGPSTLDSSNTDIPMPPEQRNRDINRPLTPIGEDIDMDADDATTHPPKAGGPPSRFERSVSDSWPLPESSNFGDGQRPQSADGPLRARSSHRPALVKRHGSQISQARTEIDPKSGKEVIFGRTGKKKKFQGLRRVLGLHD